jgi:acyl-CoA dehydrogenase
LKAAHMMDTVGNKAARQEIAMIKVAAPAMACQIIDWAIQVFGGGGTGSDHFLTAAYAMARVLRLADGPDEVHRNQIAKLELRRHRASDPRETGGDADVPSRETAAEIARNGLWPRPADWP